MIALSTEVKEVKKYKCLVCNFETDQNRAALEHVIKTWHEVVKKLN